MLRVRFTLPIALALVGVIASNRVPAGRAAAVTPPVAAASDAKPLPALTVRGLRLEPASLTLEDGRDARRVLVWAETDSKFKFDVTGQATLKADSSDLAIDEEGYITPKKAGNTTVTVSFGGKTAKLPVRVENAELAPVRFVRDIEPILSKAGCSAGTCHGSAKGKNGFKLSLRGYDPDFDYHALVNDLSGRRFNRVEIDQSLMLLKPTAEVPHEGRQAIKPGSRYHQLLRQWIAEGARNEDVDRGRVKMLVVFPPQADLDLPGRTQQTMVWAEYADGTSRDVTREVVFSSSNKDVAEVKDNGLITAVRRGEAAILMRYEGMYATQEITVMGDRTGWTWNSPPEHNYIDKHVYAKLQRMKILPSEVCTDAEFLRRVTLDLTGLPPTSEKVHAFLDDKAETRVKREKLVDDLLASKEFVDHWANKWADLLQCNSENLGKKGIWVFREWIQKAIKENRPYDQFVRELLLAEGSSIHNPEVNYLRVLREPDKITEDVSQTFLGVRFNCNKCHDHPFEKWTQNQYYEFGAYFARVGIKRGVLGKETVRNTTGDQITVPGEEVVYRKLDPAEVKHPKTDKTVAPRVPFGMASEAAPDIDRRDGFVEWLTSKGNPLFAKAMANRLWSYFLGRGIIDPVDDIRAGNPPSNAALLEALTEEFIRSGFDSKKLMRAICTSRTYQLSIVPNKWNQDDTANFSHAIPRRLSAEQLLDAVAVTTGSRPKIGGLPAGMRSTEFPDGLVAGNDFLALFGRPKRQSACECERTSNLTLSHAMNLINGATISEALQSPDNHLRKMVDTEKDDQKLVAGIYFSILNRPPNEKEVGAVDFSSSTNRLETAQDLAWALLNSPAFLFNR